MPKIYKDRFTPVYNLWPKPICAKCGKVIEDFKDEAPVKFLRGEYAIFRMFHEKCYDEYVLSETIKNCFPMKGWKK